MAEKLTTKEEKEAFAISRGWSQWYNLEYWVHRKTVADPTRQDHTNYGMSLDELIKYEEAGCPKLGFNPLDIINEAIWSERLKKAKN